MPLNIPEYNSVYSNTVQENIFGQISSLNLNEKTGNGGFTIDLHPTYDDRDRTPIGQISIGLGDLGAIETFATFSELMENTDFQMAYNTILGILYQESLKHSDLLEANITEI